MLVLDLSGSVVSSSELGDLKNAATATLNALDAADGSTDSTISGNSVGITVYHSDGEDPNASVVMPIGSSYGDLATYISSGLPTEGGGSPHNLGIDAATAELSDAGGAHAIVLITDGQTDDSLLAATTASANAAKSSHITIVPIGVGGSGPTGTANAANLKSWATDPASYQDATPGPINKTKLVSDLGAAVSLPTNFTVTEALGAHFNGSQVNPPSTGTVTPGTHTLQWTGTINGTGTATLTYKAQRDGTDVFATTNELVSTQSIAVTGGTGTVTPPASFSVDVLPCGGTPIAATTCTGAACSASGTQGGTAYTLTAGTPPAGTSLSLAALNTPAPPAGVCPGFASHTSGAEFDIRPLTTDATLKLTIPKAALGTRKWFQTDVCLGTNLQFITEIASLRNLAPLATFVNGGTLPGRWWGLLPSIPRLVYVPGRGFVFGPFILSRSQDSAGNAVVVFRVPFIPNSTAFTTDGKAAYDPKFWG